MRPPPLALRPARSLLASLCLGTGLAVGAPSDADTDTDVYKCEGSGMTEYSDTPCPGGRRIELEVPGADRAEAPEAGLRPGEVEMLERSEERAESRQARRAERERARREAMLRAWLEHRHADQWAGTLLHRGHPHPPLRGHPHPPLRGHHRPHHPGAGRHHPPGRGPELRGRGRHRDHPRRHDDEPQQELKLNRR